MRSHRRNRYFVEALDRTLRDLTCVDRPFRGKAILLFGDSRQTGPVVPFGADAGVVQASYFFPVVGEPPAEASDDTAT